MVALCQRQKTLEQYCFGQIHFMKYLQHYECNEQFLMCLAIYARAYFEETHNITRREGCEDFFFR